MKSFQQFLNERVTDFHNLGDRGIQMTKYNQKPKVPFETGQGVRWMLKSDVLEIAQKFNVSVNGLLAKMASRDHVGQVIDIGNTIKGYLVYQFIPNAIQIHNIAVEGNNTRYFELLLGKVVKTLNNGNRQMIIFDRHDVTPETVKGYQWLASKGFESKSGKHNGKDIITFTYHRDNTPEL